MKPEQLADMFGGEVLPKEGIASGGSPDCPKIMTHEKQKESLREAINFLTDKMGIVPAKIGMKVKEEIMADDYKVQVSLSVEGRGWEAMINIRDQEDSSAKRRVEAFIGELEAYKVKLESLVPVVKIVDIEPKGKGEMSVPTCPACQGEMYDNRGHKLNPKGPDFKCKDKQCGKAAWISKKDGKLTWSE